MKIIKLALIFILTGCSNLRPVYYNDPYLKAQLSAIEIKSINSINGAKFYRELENKILFDNQIPKKYSLEVSFNMHESAAIIEKSSNTSREQIKFNVTYKLKEQNQILIEDKFVLLSSYNASFTPYTSYVHKQKILSDITKHAATKIINKLIIYFKAKNYEAL